jgi:trehalose 6-phosphate phosphatase
LSQLPPLLTEAGALRPLPEQPPFGILSDIDGTLSAIAPRPEEAYVPDSVRTLLGELTRAGARIGLITGRPLAEAQRRVGLETAAYAGNHGLELAFDGKTESAPGAAKYVGQAQAVIAYLENLSLPGVRIENKGPIVALHYRQSPDPEASRKAILSAVAATPPAGAFRMHEGKKIVELRPPLPVNKGTAAETMVRRLGLRSAIALGDDVTDIDMFEAIGRLREAGRLQGARIAVQADETPASVFAAADYRVEGVEGVERLLASLLKELA